MDTIHMLRTRRPSTVDRALGWAMPSARAATASQPSLLRVSGRAGIAIAALNAAYFGGQLIRGLLS